MKTIAASDFKARCLRLMDEVESGREPLVITKNGRPVAKLVPADERPHEVLGCLQGRVEIVGDLEAPLSRPEDWEALR